MQPDSMAVGETDLEWATWYELKLTGQHQEPFCLAVINDYARCTRPTGHEGQHRGHARGGTVVGVKDVDPLEGWW